MESGGPRPAMNETPKEKRGVYSDESAAALRGGTASPEFQTLHEIVKKARQNLDQNDWDYIVGGTESETTLRRNRMALDSLAFRPRVLRDVSRIDAAVERFGRRLRLPVVLAPVGALDHVRPRDGEGLRRVLPHRRHRGLQPARARPRQTLRHRGPPPRFRPRVPGGARLAHSCAHQAELRDSAGAQGHRHARGRRAS